MKKLIKLIHDRYDDMSKSYQKIALYLTQNPNDVAVLSVNAIGAKCGIHASSFCALCAVVGLQGVQGIAGGVPASAFHGGTGVRCPCPCARGRAWRRERGELGFLADLVARDVARFRTCCPTRRAAIWTAAAELMEQADTVYLIGQLRSAPVVELLRYVSTMLGKRTVLLDPGGGLATHMAKASRPNDLLLVVSFRFYATEVVNVAEGNGRAGVPIVAITDSTLSPYAKLANVLFAVPEHEYTFSARRPRRRVWRRRRRSGVAAAEEQQQSAHSSGNRALVYTRAQARLSRPPAPEDVQGASVSGPSGTGIPPATAPQTDWSC